MVDREVLRTQRRLQVKAVVPRACKETYQDYIPFQGNVRLQRDVFFLKLD